MRDLVPEWPAEIAVLQTPSQVGWFAMAKTQPVAATLSRDQKLRILSFPDGAERRAIDIAGRDIDVFALAPDGRTVAIGDHKGRVSAWATDTGEPRLDLHLARYPGLAVFSHDGKLLAITAQGDPVQLLDVATGRPVAMLGHPIGGTSVLAFSRDDRLVATGDGDAVIRVYEAHTGRRVSENREFLMTPLAIDFTADGVSVIAGSGDRVLLFVDTATGKTTRRMERTAQPAAYVEVSPDGTSVTTGFMKAENMTQPEHVFILETKSGQRLLDWLPPNLPVGAGWTGDGRMLAAFASPDALHLWRLR